MLLLLLLLLLISLKKRFTNAICTIIMTQTKKKIYRILDKWGLNPPALRPLQIRQTWTKVVIAQGCKYPTALLCLVYRTVLSEKTSLWSVLLKCWEWTTHSGPGNYEKNRTLLGLTHYVFHHAWFNKVGYVYGTLHALLYVDLLFTRLLWGPSIRLAVHLPFNQRERKHFMFKSICQTRMRTASVTTAWRQALFWHQTTSWAWNASITSTLAWLMNQRECTEGSC